MASIKLIDIQKGSSDYARQISHAISSIGESLRDSGIALTGSFTNANLGNLSFGSNLPNLAPQKEKQNPASTGGNKPPATPTYA